jgi:hypothetical protein
MTSSPSTKIRRRATTPAPPKVGEVMLALRTFMEAGSYNVVLQDRKGQRYTLDLSEASLADGGFALNCVKVTNGPDVMMQHLEHYRTLAGVTVSQARTTGKETSTPPIDIGNHWRAFGIVSVYPAGPTNANNPLTVWVHV